MREFTDMLGKVFAGVPTKPNAQSPYHQPPVLDRDLWATLAELGLTRLTGTEEHGGSGAGWTEAAHLLAAAGGAPQLPPITENDLLAGWLIELSGCATRDSETDLSAIRTAAILSADGAARHVPWARDADALIGLWESDGRWQVAEFDHGAIASTPAENLAGMPRDHVRVDLSTAQAAPVPADTAELFLRRGAHARTLAMAGALERVLALAVEHANTRVQFGRPLGRFQAVQHLVADIAVEAALTRSAATAATRIAEDRGFADVDAGFAIAAARSCAGHAAGVAVRNAHQAFGAIGFTAEHELHRHTNALLAWRSEYGSVRFWDERLLTAALEAGDQGLWPLLTSTPAG